VAIYVDDMLLFATVGRTTSRWSHLFSYPHDQAELDAFARQLGLRKSWEQRGGDFIHYDVVHTKRDLAIRLGAIPIAYRDLPNYSRAAEQ
jgi:hypothetical protein